MPQLETVPNPCPKCSAEFEAQRTSYCREFLRYQRENFSQRTEINALEVQLKHALENLLRAERELIQAWKTSQQDEPVQEPVAHVIDNGTPEGATEWIPFTNRVEPLETGDLLYTTPPQRKPLTNEQADQIISGLQTCHNQSSKREFLKVWLRDWAAHNIKEQP